MTSGLAHIARPRWSCQRKAENGDSRAPSRVICKDTVLYAFTDSVPLPSLEQH